MKLFSPIYNSKNSISPIEDILKELSLFKQTTYCFEHLKKNFPDITDCEIAEHAQVASSCFRQAFEFYTSAKSANITTSPLLYSYSLNNFAKGLIYLSSFDSKMTDFFKKHGFKVENKNINNNLLESLITIEKSGPPTAILMLLDNHIIEKQTISFRKLLEHIPEIADIYTKITHYCSHTAKLNESYYEFKSENWDAESQDLKDVADYIKCVGTYSPQAGVCYTQFSMASKKIIEDNCIEDNIYYKDMIILPIKLTEGIFSINVMYYSYLIIMAYGMLVRYNADKWEKFIDTKISNESILIKESILECVKIFIIHIHMLLFNYTYENLKYSDDNVKKVIKDSTKDIMKNIKSKIKSDALMYGENPNLPW